MENTLPETDHSAKQCNCDQASAQGASILPSPSGGVSLPRVLVLCAAVDCMQALFATSHANSTALNRSKHEPAHKNLLFSQAAVEACKGLINTGNT